MNVHTIRMRNRIRQIIYSPKKSRILNQETLQAIEELDEALEKRLSGLQAKARKQKR